MFDIEDMATVEAIEEFIDSRREEPQYRIHNYRELAQAIRKEQNKEWRAVLMKYTLHFITYITH